MSYSVEELQKLMESFERTGLTRFRYSTQDGTLEFRNEPNRNVCGCLTPQNSTDATVLQRTAGACGEGSFSAVEKDGDDSVGVNKNASSTGEGSAAGPEGKTTAVKAPLAGIFYRASKPGEKPFVEEGQRVKKGDIVGLVEAMKMMNEIPSPCDGVVREIRVGDAAFAEYDAVLMTIEES